MNFKNLSCSAVIPNYNGRQLLSTNLPKIIEALPKAQIIVVDDASTDDSVSYIRKNFPGVLVVEQDKNTRFAAACNAGVKRASGEIILLLNSDVVPQKDFLLPLLRHFTDPRMFAVGCREIDKQNRSQGKAYGTFSRGFLVHGRSKTQTSGPTLWVFGGSGAFRKSMWTEMGGMDPLFAPAYEEDRDLSYRALKRGYKIWFEADSVVYHQHESTNSIELGNKVMRISSYKNLLLFTWKNITHLPYLLKHLLWLPYHLIFTSIRSRGDFLVGFYHAIKLLLLAIKFRSKERKYIRESDEKILQNLSI